MWQILLQLSITLFHVVLKSLLNITACILLSRLLREWFDLHALLSFMIANYCISKIIQYIQQHLLRDRLTKKEPDEIVYLDQLSFHSSNDILDRLKFDNDWQVLLKDDRENLLSSIVNIVIQNRWLFLTTIILINYQINGATSTYVQSLSPWIALIILLVSGSAIRYQTLFEREREDQADKLERSIVYLRDTIPTVSIGVKRVENDTEIVFTVQSYQLNSKFNDYFYDLACFACKNLIELAKNSAVDKGKSIRLVWALPICKNIWSYGLKAKEFLPTKKYRDFSFMPLVHSHVQVYQYEQSFENITEERKKNQ